MDKIRVNYFVNTYADVMGLSQEIKNILIELMENIITKYEKIVPQIPADSDLCTHYLIKPVNGYYSTEDFFLNRLMRNTWNVNIYQTTEDIVKAKGGGFEHFKGNFDAQNHAVELVMDKIKTQGESFQNYYGSKYNEYSQAAFKKVIMHEFEHSLQARYDDNFPVIYRANFKKLAEQLEKQGKYSDQLRTYKELNLPLSNEGQFISVGPKYNKKYSNGESNYSSVPGEYEFNEVLNETESLEMSKQDTYLVQTLTSDGTIYKLRDPESSNGMIANYGDLFKIVFGETNSFRLMYINPSKSFTYFNNLFNEIFQKEFSSDKDAIEIFMDAIHDIVYNNRIDLHAKLCTVLARCLEKRINQVYDNPNVSNEELMNRIKKFKNLCISNIDKTQAMNMEHTIILKSLFDKVKSRDVSQQNTSNEEATKEVDITSLGINEQVASFLTTNGIDLNNLPSSLLTTINIEKDAQEHDYDYYLTTHNHNFCNKVEMQVSIKDVVGLLMSESKMSIIQLVSSLYNKSSGTYGTRNLDKLRINIQDNVESILNNSDSIGLVEIDHKYYVSNNGNHRISYLILSYLILKEKYKDDPSKLAELDNMFKINATVTKKSEYEQINKICYCLSKAWIDDIKLVFNEDKTISVTVLGKQSTITTEEEFINIFNNYYESLDKSSSNYIKLTEELSKIGLIKQTNEDKDNKEQTFNLLINLRNKYNEIQKLYYQIISNDNYDSNEIETLINMINETIDNGNTLNTMITDKDCLNAISNMIEILENEKNVLTNRRAK